MSADACLRVRLRQSSPIPLDVELSCDAGELVALVGPSGSGKSTILRCIAGLYSARFGSVHCGECLWDSERGVSVPTRLRAVGMVFQGYGLFDHLSAHENIGVPLHARPRRERAARINELLELVNLGGLGDRLPGQLSGGQKQRVALARALACEPRMLLLDEPFSAVDHATRRKLRRELARLRRSLDIPILLVTHDLDEAFELADRMCIVHHGRTLVSGKPTEVMNRPPDIEVARLVGLNNIFEGTVIGHDETASTTRLQWNDTVLECVLDRSIAVGEEVDWVIPANRVLLHQRVRPSRGERENPLKGEIVDLVALGETVALEVRVEPLKAHRLSFTVPLHVAERNSLAVGERIGVSLKAEGIHIMRRQPSS